METREKSRVDFSIVIPTYNRPISLAQALGALLQLDYPRGRFEVVIVDDGSPTSAAELVEKARGELQVNYHYQANAGPSTARNRGAELARGRFIAFMDDDCLPEANWLTELFRVLNSEPDLVVGGKTVNYDERNIYALTWHLITDMVYSFNNPDPLASRFFASNNFALSADTYRAVGGFHSDYSRPGGEDREFCDRCLVKGRRLVYIPSAVLFHNPELTLASFARVYLNYGRGAYHYQRTRRERSCEVQDLKFHFALPRLLRAALAGVPLRKYPKVLALMLLWQINNVLGFALEARKASGLEDGAVGIGHV